MLWRNALQAASLLVGLWSQTAGVDAIELDITSKSSILEANDIAVTNALTFYHGDQPGGTPGILDGPYYWWECGGLFGTLIQRWSITGNDSLNNMISQGLQFQVGPAQNFEPLNQTKDLGNDDQMFWAFAAMDAAETGFPNPPSDDPSWLALAQAVFNRQSARLDPGQCGGGMRWQIYSFNPGWDYKNVMSNGGFFQLAARLARYTGNETYANAAEKMYDWIASTPIFDNSTSTLQVWDGIHVENCSQPEELFWSYNSATLLVGAAYMYNHTNGAAIWQERIEKLLGATNVFFVQSAGTNSPARQPAANGQIMSEVACEFSATETCDQDEPSFKAYTSRWLAVTSVLAPFTNSIIFPRLQVSAQAAAQQCVGNGASQIPGTSCGRRWYQTTWDGYSGLGEQMSAMSVFQSLLIHSAKPPLTASTGGLSVGDAGAGNGAGNDLQDDPWLTKPITAADQFGASVLTILSCGAAIGTSIWMVLA